MINAVEFRLYNAAATTWVLLPHFVNVACDSKYNDLGAFQMAYPLLDDPTDPGGPVTGAKTLGITDGSIIGGVAMFSDGTQQEFERYLIQSTNDEKVKDGKRLRTITGRSTLAFLEDARVYPSNWPVTAPSGHQFVNSTAGTVFRTLIDRAQARGALTSIVETGFSGTQDSTGAGWSLTLGDQNYENGITYLQIAQDLMQRGIIDVRMDGWNLVIQNGGTMGSHIAIGSVELRPAKNVTEMTRTTDSSESASTVLIGGEEGTAIERHSSSAQTLIGRRREWFVSQGGIADSGTLTILADAELELVGRINTEETVGVSLANLTPWKDFAVADWVWARFEGNEDPVERRVRQIALSIDENGGVTLGLTLNSIIEENDVKLQRKIDGYAGSGGTYGSLPTTPDSSIPNAPTLVSGGISSATFVDASGNYVAAVTATWTPPTTNVGGSTLTDLDSYELMWRYFGDTNWSPALPSSDNVFQWSPVAPGRQIEVKVRAVDNSTNRSGFSSTVTHTVAVDTTAPPKPSTPVVNAAYAAVAVKWDGLGDNSGTPVAMPNDLDRLEIWQSATSGFTIGAGGSSLAGYLNEAGTYFVQGAFDVPIFIKTRAIDKAGNISTTSSQASASPSRIQTGDIDPDAVVSDGLPPASSPDPTVVSGLGFFIVKWTPIANHDLVNYEVHVSPTLGFTATFGDPDTVVGTTTASQLTVRRLAGPLPSDPDAPDPYVLDYDTTYYVRVIAFDADGNAAQSLQSPASVFRVTGPDIAVNSVTADNIVAGTLTGELFSATVIMAGTFKTAETGQRVEWGIAGIRGYKANGDLMVYIPTTDGEEMVLDGEFIARGLTVTNGATFRGDSEMDIASTLTLLQGAAGPSVTPVLGVTYDTLFPSTSSLSSANRTNNDPDWGLGGPFHLVPSEVTCIEWRTSSSGYFVLHQKRSNGTRAWYFDSSGNPKQVGGAYFGDLKNWETWSALEVTTSTAPKNGIYVMFRYMPGAGTDYWVSGPAGLNRYSRQNGTAPPALGTNGTDVFTAEVVNTDDLRLRYWGNGAGGLDGSSNNLTIPSGTLETTQGYNASLGMCTIPFDSGGFDFSTSPRWITAQRGTSAVARSLSQSGANLYPAGTGNNWASANLDAESFECPTSNRRGIAWDGTQFWTYGSDGYLYKHTAEQWDPAVSSSTYWGKSTFYDSVGTTHETQAGPVRSYTAYRRAKNFFTVPTIPTGGADDPNQVRLYMARGATAPANTSYHLQYTGSTNTTFTTLATATANPPTVNNFPAAAGAVIDNEAGTLLIGGDGNAKFAAITNTDMSSLTNTFPGFTVVDPSTWYQTGWGDMDSTDYGPSRAWYDPVNKWIEVEIYVKRTGSNTATNTIHSPVVVASTYRPTYRVNTVVPTNVGGAEVMIRMTMLRAGETNAGRMDIVYPTTRVWSTNQYAMIKAGWKVP